MKRELYLQRLRPQYDTEQIKVISGVRRCGKSTLMRQIIEEVSEYVNQSHLVYINLEYLEYECYCSDYQTFYSFLKSFVKDTKKYYFFIDEIQHLDGFEKAIASLKASTNCSIFLTGSNMKLLNGKLTTLLTGRTLTVNMFPFSYSEASQYMKEDNDQFLNDYLRWGGLPLRFQQKNSDAIKWQINEIFQQIVSVDIVSDNLVKDSHNLRNFLAFVLSLSGNTISKASASGFMSEYSSKITANEVYSYLSAICNAFLATETQRYDIVGKKVLATLSKYYAVDPSFITIARGGKGYDTLPLAVETVIHNELLSRGYGVYIGKTRRGEVDFIVTDSDYRKCYIQATVSALSEDVHKREFGAFKEVKDHCPKYVISMDSQDLSMEGIKHLNLHDFLINKSLLSFS